jgi:hypothetical protein
VTRYSKFIAVFSGALLLVLLALVLSQTDSATGSSKKASVVLSSSRTSITYPCTRGYASRSRSCPAQSEAVRLTSEATGFQKQATYGYAVTAGQIVGSGSNVNWDVTGVGPGVYTATVEVRDSHQHLAAASVTVTVAMCGDCMIICELPCPMIIVTCYDKVKAGTPITCRVNAVGSSPKCNASVGWSPEHPGYKWSARSSNGEDLSGMITSKDEYVSIPTNGRAGQLVYATVEIPGLDPTCNRSASSSTRVGN